jgi:hypothetical protein
MVGLDGFELSLADAMMNAGPARSLVQMATVIFKTNISIDRRWAAQ